MDLKTMMISFSTAFILSLLFLPCIHSLSINIPLNNCLLNHSIPNNLIFIPYSTNYSTLIFSSRNQRVFLNPSYVNPLLIVAPTQKSHVQAVVVCSKNFDLNIRTRSGGHDYEGLSYSSKLGPFLILDLYNLRSISFNGDYNKVWVQSGATLGELYFAISSKSPTLAFPAGICPSIGVGGHLSGGGIGTIMRQHGLSIDHIIDIRFINYKGQILNRKSMGENLFWALRGGGGASFGIILAYKIKLVHVPPQVTMFSKKFMLNEGTTKAAAQWQREAYKADNRLYVSAMIAVVNKTVQVVFSGLFLGKSNELIHIMQQTLPDIVIDSKDCSEMSWIESMVAFSFPFPNVNGGPLHILLDRGSQASNFSLKVKTDILTDPITEDGWEEIWKYYLKGDEQPLLLIEPLGGKVAEIAENETPFPHRNGSKFVIQYIGGWTESGENAATKHIDRLRAFYKFMTPFASKKPRAAYLNFRDLELGQNLAGMVGYSQAKVWGEKYYKGNFERLAYVKTLVDPYNFFMNEQSIPLLYY